MNNYNDDEDYEMQARIADNALYMLIFYVIKLLVDKYANQYLLLNRNGTQVLQYIVKYLIKFYNVLFNMSLFLEMMLVSLAAYQQANRAA